MEEKMAKADIKAIKAGRLINGTGAPPLENATVLIEGARIKAVGQDIKVPKEAQVINATDKTVMPGLIDAHMHCDGPKADDTMLERLSRPREVGLIKAISDVKFFLSAGFTTVRSCGGTSGVFLKQALTEGVVTGLPRMVVSGYMLQNSLGSPYKYMPPEYVDGRTNKLAGTAGGEAIFCDGVDECIKATRYTLSRGSEFVKIWPRRGSMFNQEELKAISQTASQTGRFVAVHCESSNDAKNAIMGGAKTVEHIYGIEDDAVEMGIKAGAIFTSNFSCWTSIVLYGAEVGRPPGEIEMGHRRVEQMAQGYKRIKKLKGILAIGTDSGGDSLVQKLGSSAVEMELLVKNSDFTPMEAIIAATKNGALACFMGDKTGTIEPGKLADIIIVDGNPLSNIKILQEIDKIKMVMLEGKIEIDRQQL
jgi:imidazolonepropionase-like amidohydrolase